MKYHKGFAVVTMLLIALGIIILGGVGYVALNPSVLQAPTNEIAQTDDGVQTAPGDHPEVDHSATDGMTADAKSSITWKFTSAAEVQGNPYTSVTVVVNGTAHDMGKFLGSCSEVGASGGIDGKGLLTGELSAAQCYFAGGGNEIGVFANEIGGFEIMVGSLSEGEDGAGMFRGDFKIKTSIKL